MRAMLTMDFDPPKLTVNSTLRSREEVNDLIRSLHLAKRSLWPMPKKTDWHDAIHSQPKATGGE